MKRVLATIAACFIVSISANAGVFNIADLDKDGVVNLRDLAIMADNWMVRTVFEKPDIQFVSIPGGTFYMGDESGSGRDNERPRHTVTLTPFELSAYEVTNKHYALFLNAARVDGIIKVENNVVYSSSDDSNARPYLNLYTSGSPSRITFSGTTFGVRRQNEKDMNDHPVIEISWYGAKAFCDYYGYRLPTEAEWEFAARGGYDPYAKYPWGSDSIDEDMLNHNLNNPLHLASTYTSTVGYYPLYGYGLSDMAGNVFEWCSDWHSDDYYEISPENDPPGPDAGTHRVLRGGSWLTIDDGCRVAYRFKGTPYKRNGYFGFRPARDLPNTTENPLPENPGIEFVSIPGGTSLIGDDSPGSRENEKPCHIVTLRPFKLSKYEVTNSQYAQFLNCASLDELIKIVNNVVYGASDTSNSEPYLNIYTPGAASRITCDGETFRVRTQNEKNMDDHPVIEVSWYGAKAFCDYYGFRLPTEAEWEHAARGEYGPAAKYPWGNDLPDENLLNHDLNNPFHLTSTYTSRVGYYPPHGYGLCDMAGNVYEWCADWHSDDYYDSSPEVDPTGPEGGTRRILRGGSWLTIDDGCRVSYRFRGYPYKRNGYSGFRPACDIE